MPREGHVIGRDSDGHRWPIKEGWRCMYCGVRDTRMVMHLLEGHEPEILLASIDPCKATKSDKEDIDRLFPMAMKNAGKLVSEVYPTHDKPPQT